MNWQAAIDFVAEHGTLSEQARLAFILEGRLPTAQPTQDLLTDQRADGGWSPFWASSYTSLDATCYRLAQGEQMGVLMTEPAFLHAVQCLAQRQRIDGCWEEDEAVAEQAPPWARPGDLAARLYLTANCGFWLAAFVSTQSGAECAATYLRSYLPPDGHLPTFLHTHWLAAGLFSRLGQSETGVQLLTYLQTRLPDLHASNLAWLIVTLRLADLPAEMPILAQAAGRLAQQQQPAGNWQSEDGAERDVHATLEAMRALRWCELA